MNKSIVAIKRSRSNRPMRQLKRRIWQSGGPTWIGGCVAVLVWGMGASWAAPPRPPRPPRPTPATPAPRPPSATEARLRQADGLYREGLRLTANGQWQQAIERFTSALRLNPKLAEAHNDRATAYAATGQQLLAMADYNRAIELDPKYANAYFNRANLLVQQENYFRAINDYQRALALNPEDAEALHNQAIAQAAVGYFKEAVDGLQRAARLFGQRGDRAGYDRAIAALRLLQPEAPTPNAPASSIPMGDRPVTPTEPGSPNPAPAPTPEAP